MCSATDGLWNPADCNEWKVMRGGFDAAAEDGPPGAELTSLLAAWGVSTTGAHCMPNADRTLTSVGGAADRSMMRTGGSNSAAAAAAASLSRREPRGTHPSARNDVSATGVMTAGWRQD